MMSSYEGDSVPIPIDLSGYDTFVFKAKQVGPRFDGGPLISPKYIIITGIPKVPVSDGYVDFEFTDLDLDTPGKYVCRIVLENTSTGETYTSNRDFQMDIRESF
jgi:hypothetical protein